MIEADPGANVYFGEALTYERGAGVALWRVEAKSFDWLPRLGAGLLTGGAPAVAKVGAVVATATIAAGVPVAVESARHHAHRPILPQAAVHATPVVSVHHVAPAATDAVAVEPLAAVSSSSTIEAARERQASAAHARKHADDVATKRDRSGESNSEAKGSVNPRWAQMVGPAGAGGLEGGAVG